MNVDNGKQTIPLPLLALRLRALVLALGESVSPAWWKTEFMNETGLRFLERIYPRTSFHAAVHAAGRAACDVHDKAVGRIGVYHLFRLPESLEADMSRIIPKDDKEFVTRFRECLGQPHNLLEILTPLCGPCEEKDVVSGAKRIGSDKDLMTIDAFEKTASIYGCVFSQGKSGFPYFSTEQSRGG